MNIPNIKGCYIGLRAEFQKDLSVWYSLKIGEGKGKGGIVQRANNQALPLLFGIEGVLAGIGTDRTEKILHQIARCKIDQYKTAYKYSGSTENFGYFKTPAEAYRGAKAIIKEFSDIDPENKIIDYRKICA